MSKSLLTKAFSQKDAIIGYVTFGDYSIEFTYQVCVAMIDEGVDVIELGLPFSDPIADGPTIQESHQRALETSEDISIAKALELVNRLKSFNPNIPVIFMSSTNLIMAYGYDKFFSDASNCDGLILPDSSIEVLDDVLKKAKKASFKLIHLISPLCTQTRMKKIVEASDEFIYLISSTGITGERATFADNLKSCVQQIKSIKNIPVAVGFGVSTPDHYRQICSFADGVIIGSHFVKLIATNMPDQKLALSELKARVRQFKAK